MSFESLTPLLIAYIITAVLFLGVDFLWLTKIATDFYRSHMGDLLLPEFKGSIAALFYLGYILGIVVFAIQPALLASSFIPALLYGALFGFMAYGTYNFTNMATLKNWPTIVSIVDLTWGTCLTGASATAGYFLTQLVTKAS